MAIIETQRNSVHFEEPEPDDVVIEVSFLVPAGDGKHTRPVSLGWFPVSGFQEWVDWAVEMADQMERPIYILPLCHNDIFRTERFEPYRKLLQNLTDLEWDEMRQFLIDNCAELKRDEADPAARATAFEQLVRSQAARATSIRS